MSSEDAADALLYFPASTAINGGLPGNTPYLRDGIRILALTSLCKTG
jgi:hypothetical protein